MIILSHAVIVHYDMFAEVDAVRNDLKRYLVPLRSHLCIIHVQNGTRYFFWKLWFTQQGRVTNGGVNFMSKANAVKNASEWFVGVTAAAFRSQKAILRQCRLRR